MSQEEKDDDYLVDDEERLVQAYRADETDQAEHDRERSDNEQGDGDRINGCQVDERLDGCDIDHFGEHVTPFEQTCKHDERDSEQEKDDVEEAEK